MNKFRRALLDSSISFQHAGIHIAKCRHALAVVLILIGCLFQMPAAVCAQIAQTPPMGWNSWNHFGPHVTAAAVRAAADAMASNGMREAGYVYINIDDGWQGTRNAAGEIRGNADFPDMKALADYVHARGLKFGIYSSPGAKSCTGFEGGMGHEEQDARTFASWGVDYLKYDICSFRAVLAQQAHGDPTQARKLMFAAFKKMDLALASSPRPMVYSISQHGLSQVWKWGPDVGANLWRTGDDIHDNYLSVTEIGFAQAGLAPFAKPGHWNDPDMLEIGNGGLSADEAWTQMSLWSLLAAPLLAGNDLTKMDAESLAILTNRDVIRIDQDPRGEQGDRLWAQGSLEIWARNLADGSKAVGIFNRNAGACIVPLNLKLLGWQQATRVRDVWRHLDLPAIHQTQSFLIAPHGVVLLVIHQ